MGIFDFFKTNVTEDNIKPYIGTTGPVIPFDKKQEQVKKETSEVEKESKTEATKSNSSSFLILDMLENIFIICAVLVLVETLQLILSVFFTINEGE